MYTVKRKMEKVCFFVGIFKYFNVYFNMYAVSLN